MWIGMSDMDMQEPAVVRGMDCLCECSLFFSKDV